MNIKLYSLIRYLQKPGGVSIEELQEGLNISRASVFRYLTIIQEMNAVADKRVCIVTYRAVNGKEKTYRIMPLVVFSYMGGIYTIVETDNHEYTSKLAVERIHALTVTDKKFVRKTSLDIPWIMTDPFGLIQTDQFEAVIKVRKESVEMIKDKAWPEERVSFSKPADDGSIILRIITSGEFELIRWLRYMGNEVKLIEPEWLVEKVKASIKTLAENYIEGGDK